MFRTEILNVVVIDDGSRSKKCICSLGFNILFPKIECHALLPSPFVLPQVILTSRTTEVRVNVSIVASNPHRLYKALP